MKVQNQTRASISELLEANGTHAMDIPYMAIDGDSITIDGTLSIGDLRIITNALEQPKPRTKPEFVRCDYGEKVSNIIMDFENNAPLHKLVNDEYWTIDELDDLFEIILDGAGIYRKVETEIDERKEFIDASIELLNQNSHDNEANHYKEWFGAMFDSGNFKIVE